MKLTEKASLKILKKIKLKNRTIIYSRSSNGRKKRTEMEYGQARSQNTNICINEA